jgi:hypothetical protein
MKEELSMEQQASYRNVSLSVRTPRFAILIDKGSPQWHAHIEGIIQAFTQIWGGEYFVIIPTDGKTIDEKFWEILEAYSPDKIGRYLPNLPDLEEADPAQYQKIKEAHKYAWALESDNAFEETWNSQVSYSDISSVEISEELSEELKNRLAPFHFEDRIISQYVRRAEPLGFPFTHVLDIIDYANDKPEKITIPKHLTNRELRLIASSRAGAVTQKFIDEIKKKGIKVSSYPPGLTDEDYVLSLERGEEDTRTQRAISVALGTSSEKYPETDFQRHLPLKISMLELARYYRLDTHRDYEENIIVVIGDEVADYCLYYCLSRMHDGVYWLPDNFLGNANNKVNNNKNHADEDIEKFTGTEEFAASLVTIYFQKVSYGHTQKRISITSASLNDEQLQLRKIWMGNICWLSKDEFLALIVVTPLPELSVNCVARVIETNNYANQQDMIFQGGKSVGRLNTPKPKNFSYVNPANHRWITSIEIDGYRPPVLPYLSKDIIELLPTTYDTRVAVDGLAYLCPNIAYFGGDIDTNTVRPTLRLVDETEIFAKYFGYSGYDIEFSDKGSYLKDTIERFGSLQAVTSFFRVKQNRDIFDQYLYKKAQANSEVIYLDTEKRTYLSFNAFSKMLDEPARATALIDELIAKDILRRGLIFQCSRCRLAAWYDMGEVSREFKCKRCDLVQLFSQKNWKSPEEPRWYYSLVETVYLCYESSSYLTALSLDKLRQQSKQAFHYICESDVKNFPQQGKKKEIDILAILDGKLILGECKDCRPKAADLSKYQLLQSRLKLKPDKFILSTTETTVSDDVRVKLDSLRNADVLLRSDLMEG